MLGASGVQQREIHQCEGQATEGQSAEKFTGPPMCERPNVI